VIETKVPNRLKKN